MSYYVREICWSRHYIKPVHEFIPPVQLVVFQQILDQIYLLVLLAKGTMAEEEIKTL